MNRMTRRLFAVGVVLAGISAVGIGCGDSESKSTVSTTHPAEFGPTTRADANPTGAPTYGTPSGMGFSTGDAAHAGGQGSGLSGYHGTGSDGTYGAITDKTPVVDPVKDPQPPVLPPVH